MPNHWQQYLTTNDDAYKVLFQDDDPDSVYDAWQAMVAGENATVPSALTLHLMQDRNVDMHENYHLPAPMAAGIVP